jgi:hypothetical protein
MITFSDDFGLRSESTSYAFVSAAGWYLLICAQGPSGTGQKSEDGISEKRNAKDDQ